MAETKNEDGTRLSPPAQKNIVKFQAHNLKAQFIC
jgi:hypothetical protein